MFAGWHNAPYELLAAPVFLDRLFYELTVLAVMKVFAALTHHALCATATSQLGTIRTTLRRVVILLIASIVLLALLRVLLLYTSDASDHLPFITLGGRSSTKT